MACSDCGAFGPWKKTPKAAIEAWNDKFGAAFSPGLTDRHRSIEFSSWLCKQVFGKEFRHVHEKMEGLLGVRRNPRSRSVQTRFVR